MRWNLWVAVGSLLALFAVMIGAFAAHGLKARLGANQLEWIDIGVRYQMFHALGLILLGILLQRVEHLGLVAAGWLFIVGILLFSGSLYVMALSELRPGILTPLGGGCLVVAWLLLAGSMLRL